MRTYLPIHYFLISISQLFPSITHALRSLEDGLTALPFLPTVSEVDYLVMLELVKDVYLARAGHSTGG